METTVSVTPAPALWVPRNLADLRVYLVAEKKRKTRSTLNIRDRETVLFRCSAVASTVAYRTPDLLAVLPCVAYR